MSGPKPRPESESTFGNEPWHSEVRKEKLTPEQRQNLFDTLADKFWSQIHAANQTPEIRPGTGHKQRRNRKSGNINHRSHSPHAH